MPHIAHSKTLAPRSPCATNNFMIGKDSHGRWVVQDEKGLHGGLFVGRADALRYALFENGNQPQAVVMVPGVFEFNLRSAPRGTPPAERRRVA